MSQRSNLKRGIGLLHLVGIEIGQTIGAGIFALTGASFLQAVFPALPRLPTALVLLVFFYAANRLGARLAVRLQAGMVAVLLAALALFVGAGAGRLEAAVPLPDLAARLLGERVETFAVFASLG